MHRECLEHSGSPIMNLAMTRAPVASKQRLSYPEPVRIPPEVSSGEGSISSLSLGRKQQVAMGLFSALHPHLNGHLVEEAVLGHPALDGVQDIAIETATPSTANPPLPHTIPPRSPPIPEAYNWLVLNEYWAFSWLTGELTDKMSTSLTNVHICSH